ncbi:MAG TPA: hypothetical protein VGT40_06010 [Methylomirabilota bacterium]|jgi:hypothetical protein|nr:hypothetical protein [Methylomirabilota bacterium]
MARLYLVHDSGEIARRRKLVPPGRLVEAWPDLYATGQFWLGATSKELLDEVGTPLPATLSLDGAGVPIYYGPRLQDVESMPLEESLQARVLSAHGIAVAWITFDRFGARTVYEPTGPTDPIFFLRRPAGTAAHIWRLFRNRREAHVYMAEYYGRDAEGREWAAALSVESFEQLLERHAIRP